MDIYTTLLKYERKKVWMLKYVGMHGRKNVFIIVIILEVFLKMFILTIDWNFN